MDMYTENLADFGYREQDIAQDIFIAWKKSGLPVNLGAGLYAPKSTYKQLKIDIENATNNAIQKDIDKNGIDKIIWRELQNHEEQYSDGTDTIQKLKSYGISAEQIMTVYDKYMNYCINNDLI